MELNKTSAELAHTYHAGTTEPSVGPKDTANVRTFTMKKERSQPAVKDKGFLRNRKNEEPKSKESSGFLREEKKEKNTSGNLSGGTAKEQAFVEALGHFNLEFASLSGSSAAVSSVDLSWVDNIIAKAVESIILSGDENRQFCEMVLSSEGNVPQAFEGSNMVVSIEGSDVKVAISNFGTSEHMDSAVWMVENNPGNLADLIKSLQSHQINLSEFKVGNYVVQLPVLKEEIHSPIHMIAASFKHHEEEKKDDRRQGQRDQKNHDQEAQGLKVKEV
ncbi:MAG: DUF5421 family protein [Victivallaceae bacterium]